MANRRPKSSPRVNKKQSPSRLSAVGLDIEGLERFLLLTLPRFSEDSVLGLQAKSEFTGLSERLRGKRGLDGCYEELNNAISMFVSFLNSSPSLPPVVVYEVHCYTGQIREAMQLYECAIQSYMKAIWIASYAEHIPSDLLALSLHRLGKICGKRGMVRQGKNMLEKAVAIYEESNVAKDHPCVIDAKEAFQHFKVQCLVAEDPSRFSMSDGSLRRLDRIREGSNTERRLSR